MCYEKYIGIDYLKNGRDASVGLDCWGLVRTVLLEVFGAKVPSYAEDYTDSGNWKETLEAVKKNIWEWQDIPLEEVGAGDVVLLKIKGNPIHTGIMIDGIRMLHIMKGMNSVVDRIDSPIWNRRIMGFYRYEEHGHA